MSNEIMPAKQKGYRPATVEEELKFTKSGGELLHATNQMQLVDARLLTLEEKKENLLRQLKDAQTSVAAAHVQHAAVLDALGIEVGDNDGLKKVDGIWYIREKADKKE